MLPFALAYMPIRFVPMKNRAQVFSETIQELYLETYSIQL